MLRQKQFRRLFIGVTFSRVGDAMAFVVISWLALAAGGPRAVGAVMFAGGAVTPLTAPVLGYLLDTAGLRWLMAADNAVRCGLMIGLAVLDRSGHVTVGTLMAFMAVSAALSPATELGQNVAVPVLVEPAGLDAANRLLSASWDIAAWIGPALAGVAIGLVGSPAVLIADAATFAAMAVIAARLPGRPPEPGGPGGAGSAERAGAGGGEAGNPAGLLAGFRLLWGMRPLMVLALVALGDLMLGGMMEAFLPAFSKLGLHQGPGVYGALVSVAGLGCLGGTLLLTPVVTRLGYGPALTIVLAARGLAILPLAMAGSWQVAAAILVVAAVTDGPFYPLSRTIQQRLVPAGVRGRVQGARAALTAAGFPLGSAIGGLLVAGLGTAPVAVILGLGYLPVAAAVCCMRALRAKPVRNREAPVTGPDLA